MKKLLLALGLLCPVPVFAALPSDTTWEVRTTGSDNNGGCFDTGGAGTDYSQQDAAQLSLTDLAQTLSSTTLTSATGGFTSAMVDNCIQITGAGTGAFTLGFYEITVFTDTNTVTIDRTACSTANCSGGTGAVGGALAGGDLGNKPAEAGTHTIYIKAGTYTSSITSGAGSNWYGYNASRGDHPTGTDRPLIDCASTRVNGITTDGQTQVFRNLRVANCTGDGILETGNNYYWNVKSSSNSSSGFEHKYANNQGIMCFLCEAASNSNNGFDYGSSTGNYYHIYAGYTHDNGLRGLEGASGGHIFIWSVAETNASHGVENPGHVVNSVSHETPASGVMGTPASRAAALSLIVPRRATRTTGFPQARSRLLGDSTTTATTATRPAGC